MDLGTAIWTARKARGMTQEALAERVNITVSHLKHIESGHRKPSVELLFQLARTLDLSLDSLIFQNTASVPAIRTDGLTEEDVGAIARLVDILREKNNTVK